VILIETIGVGQVELDIAAAAYTTVVVLVPESGDAIQAMKAGLMEVGDLFVINKSDREGADRMALEVEAVLGMRNWPDGWRPRVIKTVATGGLGVPELAAALAEHRTCLSASGALAQKRLGNVRREVIELVNLRVEQDFWQNPRVGRILEHGLDRIARGEATPYQVADELIRAGKES
jgi:LAO/AO transport system kinase